jgi:hypothetical protein
MTKFAAPNFTQVPHLIIDSLMAVMPNGAFKCMMVIFRHTLGWQRRVDKISLSTFQNKTGLSKQGVINGIEYIEEHGLAIVHRDGTKTNVYEILIEEICEKYTVEEVKKDQLVSSIDKGSQVSRQAQVNSVDKITESLNKQERNIKTNKQETPSSPSEIVVCSFKDDLLKKTKLSASQRIKMTKDFAYLDNEVFKKAIDAFFEYEKENDIGNYIATLISALGGQKGGKPWEQSETKDLKTANKERTRELLGSYDNKSIGDTVKFQVSILNDCVEFATASISRVYSYDAKNFKKSINAFFKKAKINIRF